MDLTGIKAVIFDMDGVLLDTESLCKKCWRETAAEWGLKDVDTVYFECVGQARQDTFVSLQRFFEKQKKDFVAQTWYENAVEHFKKVEEGEGLPKMHGVDDCLNRLRSGKMTLALASSTRLSTVTRQLTRAGLIDFFKTLTCGDSVVHSKPDPEIYLKACQSLNLNPEDCIAIEDSPNGVRSASAAGMKVIMIPDQIQPTEEIKKLCWKIFKSLDEL